MVNALFMPHSTCTGELVQILGTQFTGTSFGASRLNLSSGAQVSSSRALAHLLRNDLTRSCTANEDSNFSFTVGWRETADGLDPHHTDLDCGRRSGEP